VFQQEFGEIAVGEPAILDHSRRGLREAPAGVDHRVARCELGTATQARPVALRFGGRGAREEAAVALERRPRGADRAAIDARRAHADEEAPVEARIVGAQRAVALGGLEDHGRIIAWAAAGRSPFSDIESGPRPAPRIGVH
jgi:hypothetical protein